MIGGAPKCAKTWLGLDMAVSVASNTPFLGTFPVRDPGGALIYLAEDSASVVKARLAGLCRHRGLDLGALNVNVITTTSLRLDVEMDRLRLAETVRRLRPRMLLLYPFVRLHRLNENDAGDVSGILACLRTLQRNHDVAVIVAHHARKNGAAGGQGGQALRGSGDFHAWSDSALYVRRQREQIFLTVEHRSAAPPSPRILELLSDSDDTTHLAVAGMIDDVTSGQPSDEASLDEAIVAALRKAGQSMTREALRAQLRVRNARLGEALTRLLSAHRICRAADALTLAD